MNFSTEEYKQKTLEFKIWYSTTSDLSQRIYLHCSKKKLFLGNREKSFQITW